MATVTLTVNIELETLRCVDCGCWWGYEKSKSWKGHHCPFCSADSITDAQESRSQAERTIRSMKGAFTHLRDQFNHLKKNSIPLGKVN